MKISHKLSLQIGASTFLCGVVFLVIVLYWSQDYTSISIFLDDLVLRKHLYLLFFIGVFALLISGISQYFITHIFEKIDANNTKLKDYNHFLAHELKTPISVMYSNFDVLEYEHDAQIIKNSKSELKNMIHIIDGLLNFSESLHVGEKQHINVENFLHSFIPHLENTENITIFNQQFNFTIYSDELLFGRVVQNLIDNALKYSYDGKLHISILQDKLVFKNKIEKQLTKSELESLQEKSFTKTFEEKRGHGIGIPMLKEITKELGYEMIVSSKKDNFIVEIIF